MRDQTDSCLLSDVFTKLGLDAFPSEDLADLTAALKTNVKLDCDGIRLSYKPTYDVRNYAELLQKLKDFDANGVGGMRREELLVRPRPIVIRVVSRGVSRVARVARAWGLVARSPRKKNQFPYLDHYMLMLWVARLSSRRLGIVPRGCHGHRAPGVGVSGFPSDPQGQQGACVLLPRPELRAGRR